MKENQFLEKRKNLLKPYQMVLLLSLVIYSFSTQKAQIELNGAPICIETM